VGLSPVRLFVWPWSSSEAASCADQKIGKQAAREVEKEGTHLLVCNPSKLIGFILFSFELG
jgi:hypothetical protein